MRRASSVLIPQLRRSCKTHLPLISGGDSISRLHSVPNLPAAPAPNGSESHCRRFPNSNGTFPTCFTKQEFLAPRMFCTQADNASEIEEKKRQLVRDFTSSKDLAHLQKVFKEMEAIFDEGEAEIAGACYAIGLALACDKVPEKALPFVTRAIKILDTGAPELSVNLAMALNLLDSVLGLLLRFDEGLECLNRALRILDNVNVDDYDDDHDTYKFWYTMETCHFGLYFHMLRLGKREEAVHYFRKFLEIKETRLADKQDPRKLGFLNMELAEQYVKVSNYKEALPFCLKALDIHTELGSNVNIVALIRRLLGNIYSGLEEHEKARKLDELSQEVLRFDSLTVHQYDALIAKIEAAKILVAEGMRDYAMEILEGPLRAEYFITKHVKKNKIDPELLGYFKEVQELKKSCVGEEE